MTSVTRSERTYFFRSFSLMLKWSQWHAQNVRISSDLFLWCWNEVSDTLRTYVFLLIFSSDVEMTSVTRSERIMYYSDENCNCIKSPLIYYAFPESFIPLVEEINYQQPGIPKNFPLLSISLVGNPRLFRNFWFE